MSPSASETRCWIAVMPQVAVDVAVAGGFIEVNHGKAGPLERMRPGDGVACYSPRTRDEPGPPLQAFTALGRVAEGPMYQVAHDHQPFRRAVHWLGLSPAQVRPLIDSLTFIRNKTHWGAAFRFGYLRVPPVDFARIAAAIQCAWPEGEPAAPARDALCPRGAPRAEVSA